MISSLEAQSPPDAEVRALAHDAFDRAQARRAVFVGAALALDDRALLTRAFGQEWLRSVEAELAAQVARDWRAAPVFLFESPDGLRLWTSGAALEPFATRIDALVRGFGERSFDAPGGPRRVTLSAGLAASERAEPAFDPRLCFETLEGVAEEGLRVAADGGGGRVSHSELYGFVQRGLEHAQPEALDTQQRRVEQLSRDARAAPAAPVETPPPAPAAVARSRRVDPPAPRPVAERPSPIPAARPQESAARGELGGVVHELLTGLSSGSADLGLVERSLEAIVSERLAAERRRAFELAERRYGLQVDRMERRLGKLGRALEESEQRFAVHATRALQEAGAASAYRTVQGLSPADQHFERKLELMRQIFRANLEMRGEAGRN